MGRSKQTMVRTRVAVQLSTQVLQAEPGRTPQIGEKIRVNRDIRLSGQTGEACTHLHLFQFAGLRAPFEVLAVFQVRSKYSNMKTRSYIDMMMYHIYKHT